MISRPLQVYLPEGVHRTISGVHVAIKTIGPIQRAAESTDFNLRNSLIGTISTYHNKILVHRMNG
jgi:hypothetical protein